MVIRPPKHFENLSVRSFERDTETGQVCANLHYNC